eukprot:COSAG01_NODE_22338_length_860_cov_0.653088_1_plen_195_part_10
MGRPWLVLLLSLCVLLEYVESESPLDLKKCCGLILCLLVPHHLNNPPSLPHPAGETVPAERAAELEAESGRLREELTQAKEEVATLKARLCATSRTASFRYGYMWPVSCSVLDGSFAALLMVSLFQTLLCGAFLPLCSPFHFLFLHMPRESSPLLYMLPESTARAAPRSFRWTTAASARGWRARPTAARRRRSAW